MSDTHMLSTVAGLVGEPARTRILTALLTGRALTAKELAYFAGVTAATASSHLSRLVGGNLLTMEKQGRYHYFRLRSADVARAIEGLMTVATVPSNGWPPHHHVAPPKDARGHGRGRVRIGRASRRRRGLAAQRHQRVRPTIMVRRSRKKIATGGNA